MNTTGMAQRRLDVLEQVAVVLLYGWLVIRLWPDRLSPSNWYALLLFLSEGLVVLFLLIRRRSERISTNPRDWAVATAGTFLALLVGRGGPPISGALGAAFLSVGFAIHLGAKLSLRRSFGLVAANRGVRVGGLYRLVRHPMYAGYMLSHVGFLLSARSLWNAVVYAGVWVLLIERIRAEERVLNEDPAYREFRSRVRYRLLPGVF